jgi:hypothetical protein
MTYYQDLGTETMIAAGSHVRAVGWLEPNHPLSRGDTPREFRDRLAELSRNWSESSRACGWPVTAGPHLCGFCGEVRGYGEFAVPGEEVIYVAPTLISHYVGAHGYMPPPEFIEAVLNCAPFSSEEYKSRVATLAYS